MAPETVFHYPQYIYSFFPHKGVGYDAVRWKSALQSECRGSISDVVIGIFHWFNSSFLSMVLGSTQMLAKWVPGESAGLMAASELGWQNVQLNVPIL